MKTVRATLFIASIVQHISIGDISMHHSGRPLAGDEPDESMEVEDNVTLPDGSEATSFPVYSIEEERTLVRESTAGFAGISTRTIR